MAWKDFCACDITTASRDGKETSRVRARGAGGRGADAVGQAVGLRTRLLVDDSGASDALLLHAHPVG